MLARRSEIELRVAELADVLALPESPYPIEARDAWEAARAAVADAERALSDAAKHNQTDPRFEFPAEVLAAQRALEAARAEQEKRRAEHAEALAARERTFVAAALAKLDAARPALIDLAKLMDEGLMPLVHLRQFAVLHNLSLPRGLVEAAGIPVGLNALRRVINVTGPGRG